MGRLSTAVFVIDTCFCAFVLPFLDRKGIIVGIMGKALTTLTLTETNPSTAVHLREGDRRGEEDGRERQQGRAHPDGDEEAARE